MALYLSANITEGKALTAADRSRFAVGDSKATCRLEGVQGEPSHPMRDIKARCPYATGKARRVIEHDLLREAGHDRPRNVRIRPEDLRGSRSRFAKE